MTAATVRAYIVHLQCRNLSPWTVHGATRAVRAFLRFCAEEGYIDAAPRFAMPKLPKTILLTLRQAEGQRLLAACESDRDKALVLFLLNTRVRTAELLALNTGSHIYTVLYNYNLAELNNSIWGEFYRNELVRAVSGETSVKAPVLSFEIVLTSAS